MKTTGIKKNIKSYIDISLAVLFILYAYFLLSNVYSFKNVVDNHIGSCQTSSLFSFTTILIPLLFIAIIIYRFWNEDKFTDKFGFGFEHPFRIQFIVLLITVVLFIYNDSDFPNLHTVMESFFFFLNILVLEIILRVIITYNIFNRVSNQKVKLDRAVFVSSIYAAIILLCIGKLSVYTFTYWLGTTFIYMQIKNLLMFIVVDGYILMPMVQSQSNDKFLFNIKETAFEGGTVAFFLAFLILYFAIAIPVNYLGNKNFKTQET